MGHEFEGNPDRLPAGKATEVDRHWLPLRLAARELPQDGDRITPTHDHSPAVHSVNLGAVPEGQPQRLPTGYVDPGTREVDDGVLEVERNSRGRGRRTVRNTSQSAPWRRE